jgi:DNA-binding MarR family transcriptional regulator
MDKITPSTPIAIATERAALARMFIELTKAFHSTIFPLGSPQRETDANLALVAVAVMLGHATGHPMTATEIATELHIPRTTALRRLQTIAAHGLITVVEGRYHLDPTRAAQVPHRDKFELILARAIAVLGPHLSKMDV